MVGWLHEPRRKKRKAAAIVSGWRSKKVQQAEKSVVMHSANTARPIYLAYACATGFQMGKDVMCGVDSGNGQMENSSSSKIDKNK
jgi:hypothetical protein